MPASDSQQWWSLFREVGAVTVLHVDLTPHAGREASALSWLDDDELSRSRRFLHPGPRRRYVLCRSALRAILCTQLASENIQLAFGESRYGKPYALLDDRHVAISFNVSHSGVHGLIAVAPHGQLGVDVEEIVPREDIDGVSRMVYGPNELSALAMAGECGKVDLFYKFWTVKEALIKAVGMGFSLDPLSFEVPSTLHHGATSRFRFSQWPEVIWQIEYIGNEGFAAAVAHEVLTPAGLEQEQSSSGPCHAGMSGD